MNSRKNKKKVLFILIVICLLFIPLYIFYYTNFIITREKSAIYSKTLEIKYYIEKFKNENKTYPKDLQQLIKFLEQEKFFVQVNHYNKFNYKRNSFIGLSNINRLPKENDNTLNKNIEINIIPFEGYKNIKKEMILYYVSPKLDWYKLYGVDNKGYFIKNRNENYFGSKN